MKYFLLFFLLMSSVFGIQVDKSDYTLAVKYLTAMTNELNAFKRTLVDYDLTMADNKGGTEESIKAIRKKLLINKRIYNSLVDDLASLAFKSLYGEIKNIKNLEITHTQSCGEHGLIACKEMTLQAIRRKAIEESSASFLESNTIVENSSLTSDKIKNDFKGVIKSFRITDEELLSGGIGYKITAYVEVEGNLPKEAIEYFKSDKIIWIDEVNFEHFPSLPILTIRVPSYENQDKLTQWLGLKPRMNKGLFGVVRLAEDYHNTGTDSSNHILQTVTGVKLGYEFATWRLYARALLSLTGTRNINSLHTNTNYFYGTTTGGLDILINNFAVGAGVGLALQDYDVDSVNYAYKGIYTFFDASYRFDITQSYIFDVGVEFAQVYWFSAIPVNSLGSEINTRGVYSIYVELGYKF